MNFSSISKKSIAHPHVAMNVMLKFQKDLISSFLVFAPTRKRDAGQNPGATKIPLPLRAGDKNGSLMLYYLCLHIIAICRPGS